MIWKGLISLVRDRIWKKAENRVACTKGTWLVNLINILGTKQL